ncbi:MAG: hypothetical protein SCH98_13820 [Deferrisomatales bacterium]|nr:hypothetical protein [Deferrisomatales bacterium]
MVLFHRSSDRRPEQLAALLLRNLDATAAALESGCMVVFRDRHLRIRLLPVGG